MVSWLEELKREIDGVPGHKTNDQTNSRGVEPNTTWVRENEFRCKILKPTHHKLAAL